MALAQEDIDTIDSMIRKALAEFPERAGGERGYDIELRERTIRLEEEHKHQRELMFEGFKQMEQRFEQVDKRFEQVDKRFEQMIRENNACFKQIDKHLAQITTRMDRFMFRSLGLTISAVIAVIKLM